MSRSKLTQERAADRRLRSLEQDQGPIPELMTLRDMLSSVFLLGVLQLRAPVSRFILPCMEAELAYRICVAFVALMVLMSCSPHQQESFKTVQFCLDPAHGIEVLTKELSSYASIERMTYIDNTPAARRGLKVTAQTPAQAREAEWVIQLLVQNESGLGVTATNLGLGPNNVALGFTSAGDNRSASQFASRLINRLSRHWKVFTVPVGQGVQPMPCSSS